jgi:NitT/TauT family transport system substrate-binding protein
VQQVKTYQILVLILVLSLVGACGPAASPPPQATASPTEPTTEGDLGTLRIALLPILDVLPFHVAQQNGYFEEVGVQVEGVAVKSAQERDTLIQTGQADGMVSDLVAAAVFNQDGAQIKAVRTARAVYPGAPQFRLLAKPGSDFTSAADLAGVEVAVSQNTVIEYITHRMLEKAGLSGDQIAVQEVTAIPVRFELLINGQIEAATLPDPLGSGAIAAGAVLLMDDTAIPDLSLSVVAFSVKALETQPEAVRRFLQAWSMAVNELNSNPEAYDALLIEVGRVPESIQGTFQMPPFPEDGVPAPEPVADAVQWARDAGLVDNDVLYEEMVDDSFLP